jgi:hypothetical protein
MKIKDLLFSSKNEIKKHKEIKKINFWNRRRR